MTDASEQLRSHVPCNGCTACCRNDLLMLHPEMGDDPAQYETMEARNPLTGELGLALKHKPEGGCIYLGKTGCTIHERAPAICKEFDCRLNFLRTPKSIRRKAIKAGLCGRDVFEAGKRRLKTLPPMQERA